MDWLQSYQGDTAVIKLLLGAEDSFTRTTDICPYSTVKLIAMTHMLGSIHTAELLWYHLKCWEHVLNGL